MSATKVDGKNYIEPCLQGLVLNQPKKVYKRPVMDILISCYFRWNICYEKKFLRTFKSKSNLLCGLKFDILLIV